MTGEGKERSLQETPTWAVAVVCFILVAISIIVEFLIHLLASWLKKKRKQALHEALEKIKTELMLLGFVSLLLTVLQERISEICIPKSAGRTWHPCSEKGDLDGEKYKDPCKAKGKWQFVSEKGLHELHIFIFTLAAFHVLYCITTLALGRLKMKGWKSWEDEAKTLEYKYYNNPDRFRFARDTSFVRRHLHFGSESPILLWIVCFFRQLFASVTRIDYLALRHGFVTAHLAAENDTTFDFRAYITRSLEEDFKVVVGISPIIWLLAVLFLMSNTDGWHSYFWLPLIPLVIILLVNTKLQVIISTMALRIKERGDVIRGAPVVETGDHLFWFNRPSLLLFLIHFVLFQNAFQLAFFAFTWYKYGVPSCFHKGPKDIAIRLSIGIIVQVLCSYVTLPLYALVTQMGTTMKPVIFNERVASALESWHKSAKKRIKEGRKSESITPLSSRPGTPLHGMSPVHLLRGFRSSSMHDSLQATPRQRRSNSKNEIWGHEEPSSSLHNTDDSADNSAGRVTIMHRGDQEMQPASMSRTSPKQRSVKTQHAVNIGSTDFSFN